MARAQDPDQKFRSKRDKYIDQRTRPRKSLLEEEENFSNMPDADQSFGADQAKPEVQKKASLSFAQAFRQARAEQGAGGSFQWNGKSYSTNTKDDFKKKNDLKKKDDLKKEFFKDFTPDPVEDPKEKSIIAEVDDPNVPAAFDVPEIIDRLKRARFKTPDKAADTKELIKESAFDLSKFFGGESKNKSKGSSNPMQRLSRNKIDK